MKHRTPCSWLYLSERFLPFCRAGEPSCAVVEMRALNPRFRSQIPTFDLSFAASQRSRWIKTSWEENQLQLITCRLIFYKSISTELYGINNVTFFHVINKYGPAIGRCVDTVDEHKRGSSTGSGCSWIFTVKKRRRSAHPAWAHREKTWSGLQGPDWRTMWSWVSHRNKRWISQYKA